MSKRSTRTLISNDALMAMAWRDVVRAPKARVGRSTAIRSAVFIAEYTGRCSRCERPIRPGQDIRYHNDFPGVVHSGCRAPDVTARQSFRATARAVREPAMCPACHLEHAGACW